MISSSAGRNKSFCRLSRGFAIAPPNADDIRPTESQIAENRNPKSPENRPQKPLSCKFYYFVQPAQPALSNAWPFFTDDYEGHDR